MMTRMGTLFLAVAAVLALASLVPQLASLHLPGNHRGYEPAQPIAYSHRLHAGELEIPCLYCHFGAERSRSAGIPPANVCMNCHRFVAAPFGEVRAEDDLAQKEKRAPRRVVSPEIRKIYDALALDEETKRDAGKTPAPIEWVRIHKLPDFVAFDHRPHVAAGVECQRCHGPIQSMDRVQQVEDLSMGWCIGCHRRSNAEGVVSKRVNAPLDCSACHY